MENAAIGTHCEGRLSTRTHAVVDIKLNIEYLLVESNFTKAAPTRWQIQVFLVLSGIRPTSDRIVPVCRELCHSALKAIIVTFASQVCVTAFTDIMARAKVRKRPVWQLVHYTKCREGTSH